MRRLVALRALLLLLVTMFLGATTVLPARSALACAAAPPRGEEVRIAHEEAIIVYDAENKRQHFIRRADFRSSSATFGFLVPTPSKPTLGEVPERVFSELSWAVRPEVRHVTEGLRFEIGSLFGLTRGGDTAAPENAPVRVLGQARVAGFDATILQADDAVELAAWLQRHGFESSPELVSWLDVYVQNKWVITAFAVQAADAGPSAVRVTSKAVLMSFDTDRPFYPYREPLSQRLPAEGRLQDLSPPPRSRLLRVFYLSDAKVDAGLTDTPWSAEVLFAEPLPKLGDDLSALAKNLRFLTVFQDESYPRQGTDEVYFQRASDQRHVRQRPQILTSPRTITIFVELLAVVFIGLALVVVRVARRHRRP